ncbi:MAG: response regulator [Geobacter sp.]|nr:response regulator [Geobacter sp.]
MSSQPYSRFPWHIVIIYCITGAAWILFSDLLVGKLFPAEYFGIISIIKGWLFIIVTAAMLALLLLRYHRTQAALERRLREIVDNLPSILYVFDRNGRALLFNSAMNKMFATGVEEYRGKSREDLGISPEMATKHRANELQVLESGKPLVAEEEMLQPDGIHTFLTVKFPLTDSKGVIEAVCGVSTDITDRKQLEEQLRQSQKMEAIGHLAGGMAHDFNNILSVILGYGHILKMGTNLDDRQQEKIDQIITASERAAQLTKGLLAFSRKQVLTPERVNLNNIINNFQKFLVRIIGEDIHLQTILSKEELPVCVDSSQIEQTLVNLAANARDAMPSGGLLTIETELMELGESFAHSHGYGQAGRYAVITVSDSGKGMSEETRKRIFEPFYTTKETGKGTGLGMAIVYGIIKQHNGFINLYSEPGQGSTLRIYLPLLDDARLEKETMVVQAPLRRGDETILLAEDDQAVRKLVASVLSEFGYKVILAVDGKDAVEKFKENRTSIKLALLDMIMPKQSGMAAADEIRSLQPEVKVLFSSGYTADFMHERGLNDERLEFIMKPVQPMELLRKVREILDR